MIVLLHHEYQLLCKSGNLHSDQLIKMPSPEIVGVSEIVDKSRVPYIIVRQRLPNCDEKLVLKAGKDVSFKVIVKTVLEKVVELNFIIFQQFCRSFEDSSDFSLAGEGSIEHSKKEQKIIVYSRQSKHYLEYLILTL